MPRIPAKVLIKATEKSPAKAAPYVTKILQAQGCYAVTYKGVFISHYRERGNPQLGEKYGKTFYPSPGYAINTARKLNRLFNTDQFAVVRCEPVEDIKMQQQHESKESLT